MRKFFFITTLSILVFLTVACDVQPTTTEDPIDAKPLLVVSSPARPLLLQDATFTTYDDFATFLNHYHTKFPDAQDALSLFVETFDRTFFETHGLRLTQLIEQRGIDLTVTHAEQTGDTAVLTVQHRLPIVYPSPSYFERHYVAVAFEKTRPVTELVFYHDVEASNTEPAPHYLFPAGYTEDGTFWELMPIDDYETLRIVYENMKQHFPHRTHCSLNYTHYCVMNGHHSFHDLIETYDEDFFTDAFLLFLPMMENSGSNRHTLDDLTFEDAQLTVHVTRHIPEIGTMDMKNWLMIIEIDRTEPIDTFELIIQSNGYNQVP